MYNFALAFVICAVCYVIGEIVSTATKAWVPSVFVTAVIMMIGYWTVIPQTVVSDSMLIPFGSTIGIYLLITHMGTVISLKQLAEQWKTIVVCLAGLAGMCALAFIICPLLMDRSYIIAGLPPLTGGIIAATTMMDAANAKGLEDAALFAIAMYCVQGFAGYPLTAACLQIEGKKMLGSYRSGDVAKIAASSNKVDANNGKLETASAKSKLIPAIPAKWNSNALILGRLGLVAFFATQLAKIKFPGIGAISGAVWTLILGIIFTTIGFLEEDSLTKSASNGIVMFALMMYVFDGLKTSTPQMLASIIVPMIILIIVGVGGMAILCFIVSKILKMPFLLSFATALTALYGFPPNAIITESVCTALSETPEEKEYLMSQMFPPMIVGGFTTVTITSVIIAGIFAGMI